jgi:lysophospholipase L1-like esterase
MKIVKYIMVFVLLIGIGISAWIYYPQYQIQKIKKQAVKVNQTGTKTSYIEYYRTIKASQIHHLAIGDSIIRGWGAPKNEDLVSQFSTKLEHQTHKEIIFQNNGINGITSGELNKLVQKGKFDEEIKNADIVTLNVGGNDILRVVKKSKDFYSAVKTFEELQYHFSTNLEQITNRISTLNPEVTLVFLELYNPLPVDQSMYSIANKLLPKWNLTIYETAKRFPYSVVIETSQVINSHHLQNIFQDGVHPSSAGYSAISEKMIDQLRQQQKPEGDYTELLVEKPS